ncbi:MAG: YcjF family protein, partial [Notoacmeibacter sp.]
NSLSATGWFDMTDIKRRAPIAIDLSSNVENEKPRDVVPRAPRAVPATKVKVASDDSFNGFEDLSLLPEPKSKRWPLGKLFVSSLTALVTLWLSSSLYIWIEGLIATKPQLGWLAAGLGVLTILALIGFVVREIWAISRLSANQKLRVNFASAKLENNIVKARAGVTELIKIVETLPATAKGRAEFLATEREFLSAGDLISLAEKDLVSPLDKLAVIRVTAAAKRVSVVTAISPRAFVDIAYVLYENAKLVRSVAEIYGCRPGVFGFLRLARETVAHLAVTGVVAMGDSLIQQVVGHGMAARVSAKLGEGVLNGLMTARIGLAAIDVTRPAPFSENNRPKITQILAELNPISARQAEQ